jgi:hypothetical protein
VSAVAGPTHVGPVLLDDPSDLFALGLDQIAKPGGDEYVITMVGPGAWPEFDESVFEKRKEMLSGVKSTVTQARANWDAVHAAIFNGLFVWVGGGASAAATKAEQHSKAMQEIENQLAEAMEWCANAWLTTRMAKKAIADYVRLVRNKIADILNKAEEEGTDKDDAKDAAKKMAEQAYLANKEFLDNLANSLSGKSEGAGSPSSESHPATPLDNGTGTSGSTTSGATPSGGGESGSGSQSSSLMSGDTKGGPREGITAPEGGEGGAPAKAADSLGDEHQAIPSPSSGGEGGAPAKAADSLGDEHQAVPSPSSGGEGGAPAKAADSVGDQTQATPATRPTVLPNPAQSTPGTKSPTVPMSPSVPSAPGVPSASPLSSAASSLSSAGSPSSSAASAGAGIDPSKAAGQAPVGGAPTDPLQAFSKGFADSAGTPVHAASSGGAPPPLAPSPAVPASDAMAPASTGSGPLTQTGAQAPAAPVPTPASGGPMGGMGGGMGGMPLGPPPTAPPAAPVAPPAAAPPPTVAPPANIAGGAQVAPIPVSAARAERDAAQNAAKRSGSDPLVLARRIAAALNAPDMLNVEDYDFYWITALTAEGQIVVANNYGLAYLPAQVRLPEHVKLVSADESIPASERAAFATYPMVAVQRWAQHHDTTLRAVIGGEEHLANSDAGAHKVVLTPEDIPAKGQMAGRDRLQVMAPQIAMRLAGFSDTDLINILPPASADTNPPEDRRIALWEAVWEPLCSSASNRGQVHLQAFLAYAIHAQEWAVYEAHAATDGPDQRRAVTDFIYWQHVGQLIADGLDA